MTAAASNSKIHENIKLINDLNETLIDQIERFFISYNEAKGKKFHPLGRFGAIKAKKIVEEGIAVYHQKNKS